MAEGTDNRRLAAILAADVAGYTRLVEQDTDATVAAWTDARSDIIEPAVASHSGRIVKLTGDGFLAEFPVVQDAVKCAVALQVGLASSSLEFRMGVNLGDIVDDGQDIHGEGVNIAARIEALADEGGICVSGMVYDSVRNRLDHTFEDMGAHEVKHVSAPIQVYRVVLDGVVKSASTALALPDKPSIAVLPFDNMSGDDEQEYFTDGITEDIITALSLFRSLFVIARNSTFVYKGKGVNVPTVADELGVRYVLEGSVRKAGNRLRITAQLIDATTGGHIWAERFDRELDDIFALQDEITDQVVASINPAIMTAEIQSARRERSDSLAVHDVLLRGAWHLQKYKKEENVKAQALFYKAIEIDAEYGLAYMWLGMSLVLDVWGTWSGAPEESLLAAFDAAKRAVALDDRNELGHVALSFACTYMGRHEAGMAAARRAVGLNPGNAYAYNVLGVACWMGSAAYEESIAAYDTSLRLSPADPLRFAVLGGKAMSLYQMARYENAVESANQAVQVRHGYIFGRAVLTASLAQLGRSEEAVAELAEIVRMKPDFSTTSFVNYPWREITRDHLFEGLAKAGLNV
jgi:adenylate cyclase